MRVTKQDGNVVRFIDQCFDIEKEVSLQDTCFYSVYDLHCGLLFALKYSQ